MRKLLNTLAAIALVAGTHAAFAEDPYIESDGTQAINTCYYFNAKTKVVVDFQLTEIKSQIRLFGQNGGGNYAQVYLGDTANNLKFGYGNGAFTGVFLAPSSLRRSTLVYDGPNGVGCLVQDGATNATVRLTAAHDGTTTYPMAIFANSYTDAARAFQNYAKMRLYGFQVYEDDVLVRNYVPARRNGLFGLYDTVTRVFLKDNREIGTAKAFTGSDDVPDVGDAPHIENVTGQMVNSRHYKTPNTRFEIDFALTDKPASASDGGTQWRIAGQDSTGRPLSFYTGGSVRDDRTFSFGQGDAFSAKAAYKLDLLRHQLIADLHHRRLYFTTGEFGAATTNWTYDLSAEVNTLVATRPLALMGYMGADNGVKHDANNMKSSARAKYYRCRIFESDVLVHDYVPCVKGGEPGFRDLVDGAFVTCEDKADIVGIRAGGDVERIPDDAYVEATGVRQVIDTGYRATSATRVVADFAFTTNACNNAYGGMAAIAQPWILGHVSDKVDFGVYNSGGAAYSWVSGSGNGAYRNSSVGSTHRRRQMVVDHDAGRVALLTAGFTNEYADVDKVDPGLVNDYALALFTRRTKNSFEALYPYAKLYGLQIYEAGELVRNFLPFIQNGKVGLKDAVTGAFVTTSDSPLKCGGAIAGADQGGAYIESDGTQAMTTLYRPNPHSKVEVTYAFTEIVGQDRVFCEVNSQSMELYVQGSSKGAGNVAFIYGNPNTILQAIKAGDYLRQTAMIDFHNLTYSISGGSSGSLDASKIPADRTAGHPIAIFGKADSADGTKFVKNSNSGLFSRLKLYSMKIFESDVLLHHYLPYRDGDLVCLKDVVTGDLVRNAVAGANAFRIGGMGWNDAGDVFYTQPQDGLTVGLAKPATLSAYAPGALAYQWFRDGEALEGETGMTLSVPWQRTPRTAVYTVRATFDEDGVPAVRESAPANVTFRPRAMGIVIR